MTASPATPLTGIGLVNVEGSDALEFLQAQLMSDVGTLVDGGWQWSGWLSPKGRLQALLLVVRQAATHFTLLVFDVDSAQFAARLEGFVFRRRVSISHVSGGSIRGFSRSGSGQNQQNPLRRAGLPIDPIDSRIAIDVDPQRCLVLDPRSDVNHAPDAFAAFGTEVSDEDWHAADLAAGIPRADSKALGSFTPQMLALDRLAAFSVRKGCYPGQEIVARTHFLGAAKRRLVRLISSPLEFGIPVGESILAESGEIGRVLAVARISPAAPMHGGACEYQVLAVLPDPVPAQPRTSGGGKLVPLPFAAVQAGGIVEAAAAMTGLS